MTRNEPTRKSSRGSERRTRSPVVPVSRSSLSWISRLLLFVRAGGRCEFDGCNKYLLEHSVTLREGNFAQIAHIVAFRPDGPRGRSTPPRPRNIHALENLMLLCPECHHMVDEHPGEYPRSTLREHKSCHESRILHLTDLGPAGRTSVIIALAKIAGQDVDAPFDHVVDAVAPRYPASRQGLLIDLRGIDNESPTFLQTASEEIKRRIQRLYEPGGELAATKHLSVFALAPIPLLVFLGNQLSSKVPTDLFQRHRDTEDWKWKRGGRPTQYAFGRRKHGAKAGKVALILSLSGPIAVRNLPKEVSAGYTIYELTTRGQKPSPTRLRLREDLEAFRIAYQDALASIARRHRSLRSLHLFPAVPAPVAVLCGRELLPKVHPTLLVYDFDKRKVGFEYKLKVN